MLIHPLVTERPQLHWLVWTGHTNIKSRENECTIAWDSKWQNKHSHIGINTIATLGKLHLRCSLWLDQKDHIQKKDNSLTHDVMQKCGWPSGRRVSAFVAMVTKGAFPPVGGGMGPYGSLFALFHQGEYVLSGQTSIKGKTWFNHCAPDGRITGYARVRAHAHTQSRTLRQM